MQKFIARTAVVNGTTIVHSKHLNYENTWEAMTLEELNDVGSGLFTTGFAHYTDLSQFHLIRTLTNELEFILRTGGDIYTLVMPQRTINAFAIQDVVDIVSNHRITLEERIRRLKEIHLHTRRLMAYGAARGFIYQDQMCNDNNEAAADEFFPIHAVFHQDEDDDIPQF